MASSEPQPPASAADPLAQARAEARAARIAAAVERSKTEYQPEHAYTERGVSTVQPPWHRLTSVVP